jgi:putative AdoMet-dependent methyltransferase
MTDPFPSSDFDPWAQTYDQDVKGNQFPFDGYDRALDTVIELAEPRAGMSVLDLGTGTANLALRFAKQKCDLWCTDFSEEMLKKARGKLPQAHFALFDLRTNWPPELNRHFDRIVSAYVFHHFELPVKVHLCKKLVSEHLNENGKLIIADISFPDAKTMKEYAKSVGNLWEEELYWAADEAIQAVENAGLNVMYQQISPCAGVYLVKRSPTPPDVGV